MWRRTLDSWGYSPLDQINRNNVARLRMVWTRGIGTGQRAGSDAARLQRRDVHPEPGRRTSWRIDARTGDLHLGVPSASFPTGVTGRSRSIATWRSTARRIIDTSADDFVYALDAQTGKLAWETQVLDDRKGAPSRARVRSSPTARSSSGGSCQPEGGRDACVITAHDAQTGKELWRTRTIPATRRAGRRDVGRRAARAALARRHMDGAELRPGAESDLHRHVGHAPRAEVHCSAATTRSTCITTRRWRSTPTPARSSGTTSTSSITGISIIRSSARSSIPPSRPTRTR